MLFLKSIATLLFPIMAFFGYAFEKKIDDGVIIDKVDSYEPSTCAPECDMTGNNYKEMALNILTEGFAGKDYNHIYPLLVGSGKNTRLVYVELYEGNILDEKVDVIVSAANEALEHSAGVAFAIDCAAGNQIADYYKKLPGTKKGWETIKCPMGSAVITPSFDLKDNGIKNIIQAVGPFGSTHGKEKFLKSAYQGSMQLAQENNLRTIAFPPISTGIFGYDMDEATPVAIEAVCSSLNEYPYAFDKVAFVIYIEDANLTHYEETYKKNLATIIKSHNMNAIKNNKNELSLRNIIKMRLSMGDNKKVQRLPLSCYE